MGSQRLQPPTPDLFQLAFRTPEERREIRRRGLKELEAGRISKEALDLGEQYRREILSPTQAPPISIRWINRKIGYGVFAEAIFKSGQYVGEYTGIVRENTRYFVPLNDYCYEYPVKDCIGRSFVIDATRGNFTRYINHSSNPNLKPLYAFLDGFYHLLFFALREIRKEKQLSYDYGKNYWYLRSPPEELL